MILFPCALLLQDERMEDLKKTTTDPKLRNTLFLALKIIMSFLLINKKIIIDYTTIIVFQ